MTNAQEKAIERLCKLIEKDCEMLDEEIKRFEINEFEHFVSVRLTLGYENDENNIGLFLARDKAILYIGKRGGVKYPIIGKNGHYCLPFKWYSILQAVCDQKHKFY